MADFIIGLILGTVLGLTLAAVHYEGIRDQCEAELPRNQHCKLIAVPEEE